MILVNYTPGKIEAAKDILKNPDWDQYFILDMKYAMHETERFGFAIEILSTLNFIHTANKMLAELGSTKHIETEILVQAVDHVMKEKPFNEAQLNNWFKFWQEFEEINGILQKMYDSDCHYTDSDVDFILLGVSYEEIKQFRKNVNHVNRLEDYMTFNGKMRFKELDIETFLNKARRIISECKEPTEV